MQLNHRFFNLGYDNAMIVAFSGVTKEKLKKSM